MSWPQALAKEKGAREKIEPPFVIDDDMVELATPHRALPYDKNKDMHYDVSAHLSSRCAAAIPTLRCIGSLVCSMAAKIRNSSRVVSSFWQAKTSATPTLRLCSIAEAAFKAVEVIGMPECRINLSQAVTYMCLAPKSNAAEASIDAALSEVRHGPKRDVPSYLRDRHRPGSENYGEYKYPHDYPGHWVEQRYLPEGLERGCSINRASRAGRPIGLMPHRAIGPRGLRSRRKASSGRGGRLPASDVRGVGAQGCIVDWPPASAGPAIAEQRSMCLVYRRATCRCRLRCRAGSSLTLRKRSVGPCAPCCVLLLFKESNGRHMGAISKGNAMDVGFISEVILPVVFVIVGIALVWAIVEFTGVAPHAQNGGNARD